MSYEWASKIGEIAKKILIFIIDFFFEYTAAIVFSESTAKLWKGKYCIKFILKEPFIEFLVRDDGTMQVESEDYEGKRNMGAVGYFYQWYGKIVCAIVFACAVIILNRMFNVLSFLYS
tara:strand:- start:322 stop:675 length:354 start_codon:yes stop_codon:yes gene_type:complete